ncbi:MAG: hypothetical protein AAF639_39170 [Chloroflexota bacterium]
MADQMSGGVSTNQNAPRSDGPYHIWRFASDTIQRNGETPTSTVAVDISNEVEDNELHSGEDERRGMNSNYDVPWSMSSVDLGDGEYMPKILINRNQLRPEDRPDDGTVQQEAYKSIKPTLAKPQGVAASRRGMFQGLRRKTLFARIQDEVDAYNRLDSRQITEIAAKLRLLRTLTASYLAKYNQGWHKRKVTQTKFNWRSRQREQVTDTNRRTKYTEVKNLHAYLTNPTKAVRTFELVVIAPRFRRMGYIVTQTDPRGNPSYEKNRYGQIVKLPHFKKTEHKLRIVGINHTAKMVEHFKKEFSLENYFFLKRFLEVMANSNRTVGDAIDIYTRYIARGSDFQINISHKHEKKLYRQMSELNRRTKEPFDMMNRNTPLPAEIMQSLQKNGFDQILKLIVDTLSRYKTAKDELEQKRENALRARNKFSWRRTGQDKRAMQTWNKMRQTHGRLAYASKSKGYTLEDVVKWNQDSLVPKTGRTMFGESPKKDEVSPLALINNGDVHTEPVEGFVSSKYQAPVKGSKRPSNKPSSGGRGWGFGWFKGSSQKKTKESGVGALFDVNLDDVGNTLDMVGSIDSDDLDLS